MRYSGGADLVTAWVNEQREFHPSVPKKRHRLNQTSNKGIGKELSVLGAVGHHSPATAGNLEPRSVPNDHQPSDTGLLYSELFIDFLQALGLMLAAGPKDTTQYGPSEKTTTGKLVSLEQRSVKLIILKGIAHHVWNFSLGLHPWHKTQLAAVNYLADRRLASILS